MGRQGRHNAGIGVLGEDDPPAGLRQVSGVDALFRCVDPLGGPPVSRRQFGARPVSGCARGEPGEALDRHRREQRSAGRRVDAIGEQKAIHGAHDVVRPGSDPNRAPMGVPWKPYPVRST